VSGGFVVLCCWGCYLGVFLFFVLVGEEGGVGDGLFFFFFFLGGFSFFWGVVVFALFFFLCFCERGWGWVKGVFFFIFFGEGGE